MFLMKSAWPGTVDVGVVPLVGLVLDVADGDRHGLGRVADGAALGDVGVRLELGQALGGLHRQDGAGQRRLAVVDVADRADVDVRLRPFEYFLGHCFLHLRCYLVDVKTRYNR